jgi:competence protein ComEA
MRIRTCLLAAAVLFVSVAAPALAAPASSAPAASSSAASPLDVNAASVEQLVGIPGIGKSLAQRIVDFRQKNGPFKSVDDLLKVQGIGEKSLEKLRPHLVVRSK